MRAIRWLTSILAISLALGVVFLVGGFFVTGANRELEGLLGLALFLFTIGTLSSGILLLLIGPFVVVGHFRQSRMRGPSDHQSDIP
jgi:hypothetical protein